MQTSSNIEFPDLSDRQVRAAVAKAMRFLSRWRDTFTVSNSEELAHDAVVMAMMGWSSLRDKRRFHSFVCTIVRRHRTTSILKWGRIPTRSISDLRYADQVLAPEPTPAEEFGVDGEVVPRCELVAVLPEALADLAAPNAELLMGYYQGFSCQELGEMYDMPADCIKVRLFRSRSRLKFLLERCLQTMATRRMSCEGLFGDDPPPLRIVATGPTASRTAALARRQICAVAEGRSAVYPS